MSKKYNVILLSDNPAVKRMLEDSGEFNVLRQNEYYDGDKFLYHKAQMIYFDGGADISPAFYGQENKHAGRLDIERDTFEFNVFRKTRNTHYHFGICRGSQLLWASNGGTLWQHITGHAIHGTHGLHSVRDSGPNPMTPEIVLDDGVTSTHHQAAMVTSEFGSDRVIAYETWCEPVQAHNETDKFDLASVVEAHWHRNTRSLGIQGHPEYTQASTEYRDYVLDLLLVNNHTRIR